MQRHEFPGTFIVVEGPDGAGSTTVSKAIEEEFDAYWTMEPAENGIGEKVDEMVRDDQDYSAQAIALAFAADRMVHLEDEVIHRLKDGQVVVSDRYYYSSLVYQPALGADRAWVRELNRATIRPDLSLFLLADASVTMERVRGRGGSADGVMFETEDFQEAVVSGYLHLLDELDDPMVRIDASQPKQAVIDEALAYVSDELELD